MIGESPTRPGHLKPQPLVETAEAMLPAASRTITLDVPRILSWRSFAQSRTAAMYIWELSAQRLDPLVTPPMIRSRLIAPASEVSNSAGPHPVQPSTTHAPPPPTRTL